MTESGGVVIVGNGHGGFQVAASLREGGFQDRVVLISDEPGLPYQRPPLSKSFLADRTDAHALLFREASFFAAQQIDCLHETRVLAIDRGARQILVQNADGTVDRLEYGHLVLATGARDRDLPVTGTWHTGVARLRTRADASALKARLPDAGEIVVVGAGFIGLEFAGTAAKLGARVHVIERNTRPMSRAVTAGMSAVFRTMHEKAGVTFLLGTEVASLTGENGQVSGVETQDGQHLPASLVLLGLGVEPRCALAEACGLAVRNGIVVDEFLSTEDPAISAVGDCCAFPSRFLGGQTMRLESVQNATDQGRVVASRLLGRPVPFDAVPWFWTEQGTLRLQIAGLTAGHDQTVLRGSKADECFSIFAFKTGRLIGIESLNRPADHMAGRRILAHNPPISPAEAADEGFDLRGMMAPQRP